MVAVSDDEGERRGSVVVTVEDVCLGRMVINASITPPAFSDPSLTRSVQCVPYQPSTLKCRYG